MRIAVFSTKPYDRTAFAEANLSHAHDLIYFEPHLAPDTATLALGFEAICPFVNDRVSAEILQLLAPAGLRLLTLRSAGFNHVDLKAAAAQGVRVARVPAYSPYAVAEHAVGMILTLNRKLHRAYARVREGNFSLDGLMGFDLHGSTVGVVGAGPIGEVFCRIMRGFGSRVLAYDPAPRVEVSDLGVEYATLDTLFRESDIIALHLPLTPESHYLIDEAAIGQMKDGVMLINTSRGGILNTRAVIRALKSGKIGALGLDVYEEEADLFFEDLSGSILQDDIFARLLTFPNVLVTGHQGFFTREAMMNIAETTLSNATAFERTGRALHPVEIE
jgi:D-lactate dehydrogenase